MRRQKHRTCAILLCVVLTISNILSAGMPVYASAPNPDTGNADTAYTDEAVSPTTSDQPPGQHDSADATDNAEENDAGNPKAPGDDNPSENEEGSTGDAEDGDVSDSEDNADGNTPAQDDDPTSDDQPDDVPSPGTNDETDDNTTPGTGEETGDNTAPGTDDETGDNTAPATGEDDADTDLDAADATAPDEEDTTDKTDGQTDQNPEYPTAYPSGFYLNDITVTPRSYSIDLSAILEIDSELVDWNMVYAPYTTNEEAACAAFTNNLKILYTTDENAAQNFYKEMAEITAADLNSSTFSISDFESDEPDEKDLNIFGISGTFRGDGGSGLTPSTTYHYRLAYYYNNKYSFLTAPASFTTTEATTESSITIKDFVIEEIGYQQAMLVWTIDNPNNEEISDIMLLLTDGKENGQSTSLAANPDYIDNTKYYVNAQMEDWVADATVTYATIINGTAATLQSTTFPLKLQDIENAEITLSEAQAGSSSFRTLLQISPCYSIDSGYSFNLHYWIKGETESKSQSGYISVRKNQTTASGMLTLNNLTAGTVYEYYIEPLGRLGKRSTPFAALGSKAQPLSFTTTGITTYEDSDFPDEIFRNYIKTQIGINESDQITSDKLEGLTQIAFNRSQTSGEIRSIKGIEHLKNLTYLYLAGHAISEGTDGIGTLTILRSLFLNDNDLVSLPDLSGMTQLNYAGFERNKIAADTITNDKLPASLLAQNADWYFTTRSSQRGEVTLTVAPEYYQSGSARPFLAKVTGLKGDSNRHYTLSLTIDGTMVSGSESGYDYSNMYYIRDILKNSSGADSGITVNEGTPYTATVSLKDNYGNTWLEQSVTVKFASASSPKANTKYIRANAYYANIYIVNLPSSYNKDTVRSVELKDQDGNAVGSAPSSELYFDPSYYNPYEDTFGNISFSGLQTTSATALSTIIYFSRYLSGGDYSAVITLTDGTSSTHEKAVHVDDTAVLESLRAAESLSYDNFGDYVYVVIFGANIDPAKVHPVLYEGDTILTRYVSSTVEYNRERATYKLEKLEKNSYWNSGRRACSFRFEGEPGYDFIDLVKEKQFYPPSSSDDFVIFEHYNYKKGVYEVTTDSTIEDGTNVTVTVYDSDTDNSSRKKVASATAAVKDHLLSLQFINTDNQSYAPPRGAYAYFNYSYTDASGRKQSFDHINIRVEWYNYSTGSTTGIPTYADTVVYQEAPLTQLSMNLYVPANRPDSGQDIVAQIGDTTVTLAKETNAPEKYNKYTGVWKKSPGLAEGVYRIRYTQGDTTLYTQNLYVYDNTKFYMSSQWMGTWTDKDGKTDVNVSFSSEQMEGIYIHKYNGKVSNADALAYWKDNGFQLEIFDRLGNQITGFHAVDARWYDGNFNLYLRGLSQEYTGYYAKITKDTKPGVVLGSGKIYYATTYDANETYGQWNIIGSNGIWFDENIDCNAYVSVGSYSYPVVVTVTKPHDTDIIKTFTAGSATNQNGLLYYFTEDDLQGLNADETYRITAACADGSVAITTGYLAVYTQKGPVVHAADITLNKKALNMQIGQKETLTATVTPANTTNKTVTWSSSDSAVATVDAQGCITAVSAGETLITATTENGKKAECRVMVFNYQLSDTSLTFDLSSNESKTLKVSDGTNDISSRVTWSTTDESVAVVSGGVVTPVGAGSAVILAAVKDGPTLECAVTVSRNELTSVTLNSESCTLYVDSKGQPVTDETGNQTAKMPGSKQLRLYFTPSDTTAVKEIQWISSNEAAATVTAAAADPKTATITAHAAGNAVITATITTIDGKELKAECKVTIKTATTAGDLPETLPTVSALTNEQFTLKDVALPDGWTWKYPETSLAPFAGMQTKAFIAQYTKTEGALPYEAALPVALGTVSGLAVSADRNTIHKDAVSTLSILWHINGSRESFDDTYMAAYADKVAWSIDKASVASLSSTKGTTVTLTALGAGKAVVKAEAEFKNGKTCKAQYKITVTDGDIAEIQVVSIDQFTQEADHDPALYRLNTSDPSVKDPTDSILHVTATNSTKLTVKSSNTKVIRTGKVTAKGSADSTGTAYDIPLTISASGRTRITLTANDASRTQKEIWLDVTDAKPGISEDIITVNLQKTEGTTFFLYPNTGYENDEPCPVLGGSDADRFTLTALGSTDGSAARNGYIIAAKSGTLTGNYKLSLSGSCKTVTDGKSYPYTDVAFTVKVVDQTPKYKLKQKTKVNLFFSDFESPLEITTDETLRDIKAADDSSDFTVVKHEEGYFLRAKEANLGTNCNKKMKLTLQFEGCQDITANYTVSVEKKAPKTTISAKSVTLYPSVGLDTAQLDPKVIPPAGYASIDMNINLDPAAKEKGLSLTVAEEKMWITAGGISQNTTIRTRLILSNTLWAEDLTIPLTVKINMGRPAVKLQNKSLQLNTNEAFLHYDTASTEVMWKDGAKFSPAGVSVSAADVKAQNIINSGIVFAFDQTENKIIAKLNNTTVAKGSYKFKVNVKVTDTVTISTPLTVKVVDTAADKSVKVSSKGSIDVLNRTNTFVTVTPALKALNGTITAVQLTGNAAHLFEAECADNKVIIHAKENASLITKYNYKVKLLLTLQNAEGDTLQYTTPDISLKLKQGKPKVTIAPKNISFFSGAYGTGITRKISAVLKGAPDPVITRVELVNNNDAFTCAYSMEDKTITLTNTPDAVKGKTYNLQLKVTYKDQADNEKAAIVKYSVKVR